MAIGDVKSALSAAVAAGAFLDIQPTGTEEWVIHNIYHENDIGLQWFDGTNVIEFELASGAGVYATFFSTSSTPGAFEYATAPLLHKTLDTMGFKLAHD